MDGGTVAGIVFGVLFAVIILGFVGIVMYRRRMAPNSLMQSFDNPAYTSSTGGLSLGKAGDMDA